MSTTQTNLACNLKEKIMSKQCETSCRAPNPDNTEACGCSSNTAAPLEVGQRGPPAKSVLGQTLSGALMFAVACLACCAPLIVPVILGLVAGTPLAALLTFSSGWLVGGLALLLVVVSRVGWYLYKKSTRAKTKKFQAIKTMI
jgi:hypothetical protein